MEFFRIANKLSGLRANALKFKTVFKQPSLSAFTLEP
jgi:hypothetical protein